MAEVSIQHENEKETAPAGQNLSGMQQGFHMAQEVEEKLERGALLFWKMPRKQAFPFLWKG